MRKRNFVWTLTSILLLAVLVGACVAVPAQEELAGVGSGSIAFTGTNTGTRTLTGQTTENKVFSAVLATDSSYLGGSDLTYSGGVGSSAYKAMTTYTGTEGGVTNVYSSVSTSGTIATAGAGVMAVKAVATNTGTITDGNVYGGLFIAKHNHATKKMANEAALIGVEGWAYDAGAAPAGTVIGGNFGYHNEGTTAKDSGAVYRGVQIFLDDAAGSTAASERTGLAIWNMAGTQDQAIKLIPSGSGFTNDIVLQNGETINNATDGVMRFDGAALVTTGGGWWSSGCNFTAAGAIGCASNITSDGAVLANTGSFTTTLTAQNALVADHATIGGGVYSTGCSLYADGKLGCTDNVTTAAGIVANAGTITTTLGVSGVANLNGGIAVDTDHFTVDGTSGQVIVAPIADADTGSYDSLLTVEHALVGLGTKDRVYGIDVEMSRAAGFGTTNGDHDDAGIKVRMVNKATDNTAGTTLRGVDVNVKNDNPGGSITNLSGGVFTSQIDNGAGTTSTVYGLQGSITANDAVTDSSIVADFRTLRQAQPDPTTEYIVQVRNGNTIGTGVDAGLRFLSEASTVGDYGYVIDMNDAAALTADIRLSQGETIDNLTNGTVTVGGNILTASDITAASYTATKQGNVTVTADSVIAATSSLVPITSSGTVGTASISGCNTSGRLTILLNVGAQQITITDTGTLKLSANAVLTADDTLTLIGDGTNCVEIAKSAN
jgi:hypothetical protein